MRKNEDSDEAVHPPVSILVLNDIVIDRGPSPYLSNIDLYLDGKLITSVQGDGKPFFPTRVQIVDFVAFIYLFVINNFSFSLC